MLGLGRLSGGIKHQLDLPGTSSGSSKCRATQQRWAVEGSYCWIFIAWGWSGERSPDKTGMANILCLQLFQLLPCLSIKIWKVKEPTVLPRAGHGFSCPHQGVICGKPPLTSPAGEAPRQMLGRNKRFPQLWQAGLKQPLPQKLCEWQIAIWELWKLLENVWWCISTIFSIFLKGKRKALYKSLNC